MIKKPKINCFEPYFKIEKGNTVNDWLQVQLYWCNNIGFVIRIMGYGLDIGACTFDTDKDHI